MTRHTWVMPAGRGDRRGRLSQHTSSTSQLTPIDTYATESTDMQDAPERFYTLEEAAALSRRTPASLRQRRYRKLPPRSVNVGGRLLYPIEDFEEWLRGEVPDEE